VNLKKYHTLKHLRTNIKRTEYIKNTVLLTDLQIYLSPNTYRQERLYCSNCLIHTLFMDECEKVLSACLFSSI